MNSLSDEHLLAARELLSQQRSAATARLASLRRDFDAIVGEAELTSTDDEHDPEGSTLAFERSQTHALLGSGRQHLAAIDAALDRIDRGSFGGCESCGGPIARDRLLARPIATRCIGCA